MEKTFTVHLLQWRILPGDVEGNLSRAEELIAMASPRAGDVVLLPELFPSGFYYSALQDMADRFEDVLRWMDKVAAAGGIALAGSAASRRVDGIANTMLLTEGAGVAASYDKAHLFSVADEDLHFKSGRERGAVVRLGEVEVGLAICFDLRFPEMFRDLCDRGARFVLVAAQWPRARADHFRDFTRVRAMENQMFVASCNSCGDDGKGLVLGGASTVVGPAGDVKGALGDEEGVLTVHIDLEEVEKVREAFPVLKVRRKDLYE